MKKAYSLDYSIERDIDRTKAVYQILDTLEKDPSPTDLEQMASYILYGKDENGLNAVQRGETTDGNRRYSSYRTNNDKLLSLDEILENPLTDHQAIKSAYERDRRVLKKPTQIHRPKYNKKTGELIDIGDADIPGMSEIWDSIDRISRWIAQLEGKIPADENTLMFEDSYRLYRLKHNLIDLRRNQYYLKDAYKPTLHFQSIDHPKTQFYDWTSDAFYWMPYEQWKKRVENALTHSISKNIEDYETRGEGDTLEVKWVVCKHIFDWENPLHVRAFINNYSALRQQLYEKLDTYGRTLIWDFERYRAMARLSSLREYMLDLKLSNASYEEILEALQINFGITYNKNHLCSIYGREIPEKIAETALKHRLIIDTPANQCKVCYHCGRRLPKNTIFFSRNNSRKDGLSSNCKECEREIRI